MLDLLRHPLFARLFAAQVLSLLGAGLMTVALALLAYDLAGENAGAVLGTALTIKMVAYVGIGPLLAGLAPRFDRRRLLIALDVLRAAVALAMPFVSTVWQVYALVFLLQCASAMFTPTYQAVIPDVLAEEERYTKALSLSRIAYDLESLASPALAAALLLVIPFSGLFAGTCAGFLASALLVQSVRLPKQSKPPEGPFRERVTRGLRIYLSTPRLRGLLSVTLAAAAASAFVIVNTVVVAREVLGLGEAGVAVLLGAYGMGSMAAAFVLPRLLERVGDRALMLPAAMGLTVGMALLAGLLASGALTMALALLVWAGLGAAYAAALTPAGRLITRSSAKPDRAAVFAAQFALSHAGWLVTYPTAGLIGATLGLPTALGALAGLGLIGALAARRFWPEDDPRALPHSHPELPPDHPHLAEGTPAGRRAHVHGFVIDDMHPDWPVKG